MDDPLSKVIDLAGRARQRRELQWKRLKDEAPDIAELLTDIQRLFGKPAGVRVRLEGKLLINTLPPTL